MAPRSEVQSSRRKLALKFFSTKSEKDGEKQRRLAGAVSFTTNTRRGVFITDLNHFHVLKLQALLTYDIYCPDFIFLSAF